MEESARILSLAAGPLDAQIMFIGEAPGRLGADSSEIPFHGDKAGHNFEDLLGFAGLNRSNVFVTNAVLCNPKCDKGNNSTPTRTEIANCSAYLKEQIDLIQPKIVVTLGAVALDALNNINPHALKLSEDVRTIKEWYGRKLIPLYHPGARAMVHRSMANQRSDYQFVSETLRRMNKLPAKIYGKTREPIATVAREIIKRKGKVSYFELHKLFFLIEWEVFDRMGERLTNAFFLRQKDGPYCTDLHLQKLRKALPGLTVTGDANRPVLGLQQVNLFQQDQGDYSGSTKEIINEVVDSAAALTDAQLKSRVYLTKPMRSLLRIEKTCMINLYNSPIKFEGTIFPIK